MLDSSRFGVIIRATTKKYSDNSLNQLIMGTFKKKVERKKTENSESLVDCDKNKCKLTNMNALNFSIK